MQKALASAGVATLLAGIPNPLLADAFVTLESIVLSEEPLTGIGDASVIQKEKLERTQAKEMKDVFAGEPTISVGGGARNAQRIYLRGIEGTNLNITIDGAKQGGSLFQHAGDVGGIDPYLLKRVEVSTIAGADKGSGALGGSIAFETVDAQDLLEKGKEFGTTLRGGYYGASKGKSGGLSVFGKLNPYAGILLDVSGVDQKDYRTGSGSDAPHTATKDENYFLKFSFLDYNDHSLKLSATRNQNKGNYVWAGPTGSDGGVPSASQATSKIESLRKTYTFDYRYNPANPWVDFKTNLYINERILHNKTSDTEVTSKNTGGNIKNVMAFETGPLAHLFTVGGDYNVEDGITKNSTTNTSKTLGLFAQGNTNMGPVMVNYGVRFDDYSAGYGPRTFKGNEFSPNAGIEVQVVEGLSVFTNYSESIKIGSIIPIQWLSNVHSGTTFNGSTDGVIKPETSKQVEGGVKYTTRGVFAQEDNLSLGFSVFRTTISDLVERVGGGGGPVTAIINNPLDVISKGYEIKAVWEKEAIKTSVGFLHVNTEDENGNAIMNTRRKAGSMGDTLVWDTVWSPTKVWKFGYTLTSVSKFDDVAAGAVVRPSYVLHDVQVQYMPPAIKGLTLSLGVNNLFDKAYVEHTSLEGGDDSLREEAGRDIRVSFRYTF